MIVETVKLMIYQVLDNFSERGIRDVLRSRIFWNRLATPVAMELSISSFSPKNELIEAGFKFVEVKLQDIQNGNCSFVIPSRGIKALGNLRRGYRNFAVAKNGVVVADVWCLSPRDNGTSISHPDTKMLGINCELRDAYAFDMYVAPLYRGRNLAIPLQKFLQACLKDDGCQKVYGYNWDDNLPALWMHRMLKFKEFPKRKITRFFFLMRSKDFG
jgi:GNAT superfamily N-acetyltransferase